MKDITPNANEQIRAQPQYFEREDEISVIDVWHVLVRHKRIMAVVFLSVIAATLAYVLLSPRAYLFSATVEPAQTTIQNGSEVKSVPIENVETTLVKLTDGYIPSVLEKHMRSDLAVYPPKVVTTNPLGSNLIVISIKGPAKNESVYIQLINEVIEQLLQEHSSVLAPARTRLETELNRAELEMESITDDRIFSVDENAVKQKIADAEQTLQEIQDERKLLEARYSNLNKERELLTKQLNSTESAFETALRDRAAISDGEDVAANGLTLLMLNNEIQRYQDNITSLRRRVGIELPEQQNLIEKKIADNKRAQDQQKGLITEYQGELAVLQITRKTKERSQNLKIEDQKSRIAELRSTRVVHQPSRSIKPVGYGSIVHLSLGLTIGVLLAVFSAFVAELLARSTGNQAHARDGV